MKRSVWRGLVLLLVVSGMLCMPLAPAMALDVKLSGQVNQLVMYADDGHDNAFFIADNDNSGPRVNVAGEQDFGPVIGGVRVEIEAQRNATNELTIGQDSDGRFFWNDRWLEAYFSGNFGKVEIGKGDGAANNTAEVDLSGTSVIIYSRVEAQSGAFEWKNSDGSN